MNKSGLSMTSMVLYVALFFAFSTFAISISSNMNYSTLAQKGDVWVNEQFDKLQYNLIKSAKASDSVYNIAGKLVFSNNDEYSYDVENRRILKNGGIIAVDINEDDDATVSGFEILEVDGDSFRINVSFLKYGKTKTSEIFLTVGDDINE